MSDSRIKFFADGLQCIQGNGDLKTALGQLVQLAAEFANSTSSSFYIVDEAEQVLKPLVTFGLPESYVSLCGNVKIGEQCCGRAVEHRKPWVVSDMLTDPLFAAGRQAAVESPMRAAFSIPVITEDGRCLGSLACHYDHVYEASESDVSANRTWADMIAHTLSHYKRTAA